MARPDIDYSTGDVRIRVEGLAKTLKALSAAGTASEEMRDLMHSIGNIVVSAAHPPVGPTGRLAGSVRAGRGKTKAVVRAGGARVPYAGVIHYGWPARGISPQPFLVSALYATRSSVFGALDAGISDLLKQAQLK